MLVEMAVADAYAIAWEFTKEQKAPNDLMAFHQHPTYAELKPGQYTDDTQRSVANATVLTSWQFNDSYNPLTYARAYLNIVREDPREGYSRGYQKFLAETKNEIDFLTKIGRTKLSNGAVMGVAPMGFQSRLEDVKTTAMIQAITTHHPKTAVHAQLVAMAVHFFLHIKGERKDLTNWLINNADFDGDDAFRWLDLVDGHKKGLGTSIKASSISSYMAYAVENFDSLTAIIRDAVDRGGDTDSAAAVSVAVASCCPEITDDIPHNLTAAMDLANPGFGVEFLNKLEGKLRTMYKID